MHRHTKQLVMSAAVTLLSATMLAPAYATNQHAATEDQQQLPSSSADYSKWNVSLTPFEGNDRILELEFDSPLLDRRVSNLVYLPETYGEQASPSPVLYYLHGTVLPQIDNPILDPVTENESLLHMASAGGGYRQTELMNFGAQLDRAKFVVVAPDTARGGSWCHNCGWIDGRDDVVPNVAPATGEQVPADSYLHEELYPLVESVFNVRTDRAGRGVSGFSMGGYSAMVQGMKHPDDYSFIGSVSGVYESLREPRLRVLWEAIGYMRDQGYGTGLTHEAWWRNFNPSDLATNLSGTNAKFVLSYGDACLSPAAADSKDCAAYPPLRHPAATAIELVLNANNTLGKQNLASKGIPVQVVELPGIHGANNHRVYADHMVAAANKTFAAGIRDPETFSYRAVDRQFSVWGYDVDVRKRQSDEFLSLTDARRDGGSYTMTGTGIVDVTSPGTFPAGSTQDVAATAEDGTTSEQKVTADKNGRLHIRVDLGRGNLLPQNGLTDALALSRAQTIAISIH